MAVAERRPRLEDGGATHGRVEPLTSDQCDFDRVDE